jgi:hypothetical protein
MLPAVCPPSPHSSPPPALDTIDGWGARILALTLQPRWGISADAESPVWHVTLGFVMPLTGRPGAPEGKVARAPEDVTVC